MCTVRRHNNNAKGCCGKIITRECARWWCREWEGMKSPLALGGVLSVRRQHASCVGRSASVFGVLYVYNFTLCSSKTDVTCCVCVFFLPSVSLRRPSSRFRVQTPVAGFFFVVFKFWPNSTTTEYSGHPVRSLAQSQRRQYDCDGSECTVKRTTAIVVSMKY